MIRARVAHTEFFTALVLLAIAFVVLAVAAGFGVLEQAHDPVAPPAPAILPPTSAAALATAPQESSQGFLYGRISTVDGATFEGRLRWRGDEEA